MGNTESISSKPTANDSELGQKEIPHSAISIQPGSDPNQLQIIEAILPQQLQQIKEQQNHQEEDRDNDNEERWNSSTNRDENMIPIHLGSSPILIPPGSYKVTSPQKITRNELADDILSPTRSSSLLKQNDYEAKHLIKNIIDLNSEVTEATAAVYYYFKTKTIEDEMTPSGRAHEVIQYIKSELRNGNSMPAYQFLETAKAVIPALQEEAGLKLEADILSDNGSDNSSITIPSLQHQPSITDQAAAIFQFLDDAKNNIDSKSTNSRDPVDSNTLYENLTDGNDLSYNIFRRMEQNNQQKLISTDGSVSEMDLEFVEHFDSAFNEFLFYHPKLVAKNPTLIKNLRIYKLQKLLQHNDVIEQNFMAKLDSSNDNKKDAEEAMHNQLKEALKKKAARQTYLQSEVNGTNWSTKKIQSDLRWKLFMYSEGRAKRQIKLLEQFERIPEVKTRKEMIQLIPARPCGTKLQNTIKASLIAEGSSERNSLSSKQEEQLRELQIENPVVKAEIEILQQKLDRLQNEANKSNWVSSALVKIDKDTILQLKKRFEEKEGIVL